MKDISKKDTHFDPNLGLLHPNLDHAIFSEVSALLDVRHCLVPSCNPVQYQEKLIMQI